MKERKNSFVLYTDYSRQIERLSDDEAGQLFKALLRFAADGTEPQLSDRADMAFAFISEQIERDTGKWKETCEKRREAGKRGGLKTQSAARANASDSQTAEANQTNASFASGQEANQAENENDTVNENENENENVTVNENGGDTEHEQKQKPQKAQQAASPPRHRYGQYKNVSLTDADLQTLQAEFPNDWQQRIERVSEYVASSGKTYKNYLAVIRAWAKKDQMPVMQNKMPVQPVYDLKGVFS